MKIVFRCGVSDGAVGYPPGKPVDYPDDDDARRFIEAGIAEAVGEEDGEKKGKKGGK